MWETIIVQPFANILLGITLGVNNFGIAIILFTLLIKLVTYPLTARQIKQTRAMTELQNSPRYKKMVEKYKDNSEKRAEEQMKLYREAKVNPVGSCLPSLIQLPIILGLYQSIIKVMAATPLELVKLERMIYPFLDSSQILPVQNHFLWMDLGQPERLVVGGIGIPVLTILVVLTTWIQGKVMTPPSGGAGDQAAAMTTSMNLYMPLLMGWISFTLASGLALYFLASNAATIIQYSVQGTTDWSKVLPFIKPKPAVVPASTLPATLLEVPDDEPIPEPKKSEPKPSARAAVKQQRPPQKRKKK